MSTYEGYMPAEDIIRRATAIESMSDLELSQFKSCLNEQLKYLWEGLVNDNYREINVWLQYCRAAVLGFQCLFNTVQEFSAEVYRICYHDSPMLYIEKFDMQYDITYPESFKVSIIYGFNHCAQISKKRTEMNLEKLFDLIIRHCRVENRFTHIYLKMLVANINESITDETYYNNVFQTVYYNLENKDAGAIFRKIKNKSVLLDTSFLLKAVINNMLWNNKQKYLLICLIISSETRLIGSLNKKDLVEGLIYAQSKPHLIAYGTKLHNLLLDNMSPITWHEEIFVYLKGIISVSGPPTFCVKNILKNYMPLNNEYLDVYLLNILDLYLRLPEPPAYTILSLTILGIKAGLFKESFKFDEIIQLAWDSPNEQNRVLVFDIMCTTLDVMRIETYAQMKEFIIYNINDLQAASRDSFKNSFTKFLQRVEYAITKLYYVSTEELFVLYSSKFFNWFITFLLDQFKTSSNYARITLSFLLLSVSLSSFLYDESKLSENIFNYRQLLNISKWYENNTFLDILEVTDEGCKEQVISVIVKYVDFRYADDTKLTNLAFNAYADIIDTNKDTAERGKKIIELCLQTETYRKEHLQKMLITMTTQWNVYTLTHNENPDHFKPLHGLLALITSMLEHYPERQRWEIYNIAVIITSNFSKVFKQRSTDILHNSNNEVFDEDADFQNPSFNLMRLALKECCKLLAKMVHIAKTGDIIKKTLQLLYNIICQCYHKGLLEEAVSAIENIVAKATKNDYGEYSIDQFIKQIFDSIVFTSHIPSVFRKAAEIRYVLAAIACNDKRYNKPFFHKIIKFLIQTLKETASCAGLNIMATQTVQTISLHCLEPLMGSNSVELHNLEYMAEMSVLCLKYFETCFWNVRNAALQTFSSITKRMINTSSSNNSHIICFEEIFFKYPVFFEYMFCKIEQGSNHLGVENLTPMLTFLSLSDCRADVLVLKEENMLYSLAQKILNMIIGTTNYGIYNAAAKAYAALCDHDKIETNIEVLYNQVKVSTNSINVNLAIFTILKCLFEKLFDCAECACVGKYNKKFILSKMDDIITDASSRSSYLRIISTIMLYRPDLKSVQENDITHIITTMYTQRNTSFCFPGFWKIAENLIYLLVSANGIHTAVNMIKACIELNLPTDTTVRTLELLDTRIAHKQDEQEYCSKAIVLTLCNVIMKDTHENPFLVKQCIKLILRVGIVHIPFTIQETLMNNLYIYPECFYPLFCVIWENFQYRQNEMHTFYTTCSKRCVQTLKIENPDTLLIKAVKYVYKYGVEKQDFKMIYKSVKTFYRMLQRSEEDIKQECMDISVNCFGFKETHIYSTMMQLLDKNTLKKLLNTYYALLFLIKIYSKQADNHHFFNMSPQKPNLSIQTIIVKDDIFNSIQKIVNDDLTDYDTFRAWFNDYVIRHPDNGYLNELYASIMVQINRNNETME